MNLMIRQFEPRDQQAVINLWMQCGLVVPWNDPAKDIQRKLNAGSDLFLVAALGDLIVGSVMGGYDGHRGWINYLAISPGHQRNGIGRKLVEAVELGLKAQGC